MRRELWEQTKTFVRRYGYWGGYLPSLIGAVRLINVLAVFFAGSGILTDMAAIGEVTIGSFSTAYHLSIAVQVLIDLAMIAGGLWLAGWLKKRCH